MLREQIIISNHAKERAKELGIPSTKLPDLLLTSDKQKENVFRELYKLWKYGTGKQLGVHYYIRKGTSKYPKLLFTVKCTEEKWIIITVTKK